MAKKRRLVNVLLMEDIKDLGNAGELVGVSPGYARNFLLPCAKAAVPNPEALRQLESKRKQIEAQREQREASVAALAEAIPATNVTLEMKVSPDGRLYGAVTAQMVADAMAAAGLEISAAQVRLEETIKQIGQFDVPIHVYGDVTVNARLWVVNAPE